MGERTLGSFVAAVVVLTAVVIGLSWPRTSTSPSSSTPAAVWAHHPQKLPFGQPVDLRYGDPHANHSHPYALSIAPTSYTSLVHVVSGWTSPSPDQAQSPRGFHLVGAELLIRNRSPVSETFRGDVTANSVVLDDHGNSYPALNGIVITEGPALAAGTIAIRGGASVDGWVVFQVPDDHLISTLLVAPGGTSSQQGAWSVLPT